MIAWSWFEELTAMLMSHADADEPMSEPSWRFLNNAICESRKTLDAALARLQDFPGHVVVPVEGL